MLLFSSHYPHFPALARSLDQCYEASQRQSTNSQQINREMKILSMLNFFYRSERYCLCRNWFSCLLCLGLGLGPPGALKPTKYKILKIQKLNIKDTKYQKFKIQNICYVSVSAHREHSSLQTTQKISAKLVELPKNGNQEIDLFVLHFQKFSSKLMNPRRSIMIHP